MIKRLSLKISTVLLLSQFIISIIGVGSIACFALFSIYSNGRQERLRETENLAYAISIGLENRFAEGFSAPQTITPASQQQIKGIIQSYLVNYPTIRYGLYQADGRLILSENQARFAEISASDWPPEIAAALEHTRASDIRLNSQGQSMLYTAATVKYGETVYGVIRLEMPFEPAMSSIYRVMIRVGFAAAFIILAMLLVSWQGSGYLSQPVIQVSQVAEQLSQGNLSARAPVEGPREIAHLAKTLNNMASRLQLNLETMHSFVANASHELRTPLTSIKLQVGALRAGAIEEPEVAERFLTQMDCEIDRLVYTVNEMLDLSQMEGSSHAIEYQPVDLLDLACEVQAFWEVRSQQAGLSLTVVNDSHLPLAKGDAFRLRRLFDNLIDNAIKNTPESGAIKIMLRRCLKPDWVRFEICDTGTGIEPLHLRHIFERFYRVNPVSAPPDATCQDAASRRIGGSGLGLAIARSIVLAHNGQIGVESSRGHGSTFWVELPTWTN